MMGAVMNSHCFVPVTELPGLSFIIHDICRFFLMLFTIFILDIALVTMLHIETFAYYQ